MYTAPKWMTEPQAKAQARAHIRPDCISLILNAAVFYQEADFLDLNIILSGCRR